MKYIQFTITTSFMLMIVTSTTSHTAAPAPQQVIAKLQQDGRFYDLAGYIDSLQPGTLSTPERTDVQRHLESTIKSTQEACIPYMHELQRLQNKITAVSSALIALKTLETFSLDD